MFGLNDSSNKTNLDPTQPISGDLASLPPLTATVPADNSAGGSSALGSINENTTSAPSASSTTALDNSATATASAGIGDVSLENAYIATDPPQITKRSDDLTNKPSAASLVDQGSKNDDELIKLKQQALQDLAPLVDHLEQSNEEKFKTTMMLIQASDNSDLIPDAYEAANKIEDEKVRAQALLDVVNEINYFTQQHNK
jgi:hypothetical protein